MVWYINNTPFQDPLPRLLPQDVDFDVQSVRILKINEGQHLILYDDYNDSMLSKIMLKYGLNPDNVGLVLDEIKVIKSPHILVHAQKLVHPSKIYIRPVNVFRSKHKITEGINSFIKTRKWDKFDNYILKEEYENIADASKKIALGVGHGLQSGAQEGWKDTKENWKSGMKSFGTKVAVGAGGMVALNAILNKVTKDYANQDAKKAPFLRSKLIADLRILRGKLPEYENEYERARREEYENSNILGKIVLKIKWAIQWILRKLGLMKNPYETKTEYYY